MRCTIIFFIVGAIGAIGEKKTSLFVRVSFRVLFPTHEGKVNVSMADSKNLNQIFDQFWEWRMERTPEFASLAGDKRYANMLERYTVQRFEADLETCKNFKKDLAKLNAEGLSADEKINLKLFNAELDTFIQGFQFSGYLFPINFMEGVHVDFQRLPEWMSVSSQKDYEDLLGRFKLFPTMIDDVIDTLKHGIARKMVYNKVSLKNVVEKITQISESKPECSPYFESFRDMNDNIDAKEDLKKQAKDIIEKEMLPSVKKLAKFLETEYIPNTRPEIGAMTLPNGKKFYEQCIKFHTSTNLTAKEIHDMGLKEVERIEGGMRKIMEELGKSNLTLKQFFDELRNDKRFFFKSPEELMARFKSLIFDTINPKLTQIFWKTPKLPLEVVEMPAAMTGGPAAYYISGTADGSRPGRFFVNTARYDSQPTYETISLALHEGNPGHHFQGSYSLSRNPPLPKFRQMMEDRSYFMAPSRFPINTAFVEGWALYCENLGNELGLYGDPYDRFGHYSEEIFRASRLVVDTGMHSLGWSRQQAVDFMNQHTAASDENIVAEIDRYITWPGQALGYKVGEMKIQEMRLHAEAKLKDQFNIKEFHEVILKSAGPLDVIEDVVEEYIKSKL